MALETPPGPIILTTDQKLYLGRPPKPYDPSVQITESDGTPSDLFHRFLILHYEWERRLYAVLTGEN